VAELPDRMLWLTDSVPRLPSGPASKP
jgi:hypothetical protein